MEGNGQQPATVKEPSQSEKPTQEKAETTPEPQVVNDTGDDKQETQGQEQPGIGIRPIYLS